MNASVCCDEVASSPALIHRPSNPMGKAWHAIAARWAAHLKATRRAQDFDFASELSADTLRDIGAPEAMISQAVGRQQTRQQQLFEMRQWRDG